VKHGNPIQLEPIESIIHLKSADRLDAARQLVATCVISEDIDLDASVAPRCHRPCVCGPDISWSMMRVRSVGDLSVIGADVNKLCPQYEPTGGPMQPALTTVALWETELLAAARGRAR